MVVLILISSFFALISIYLILLNQKKAVQIQDLRRAHLQLVPPKTREEILTLFPNLPAPPEEVTMKRKRNADENSVKQDELREKDRARIYQSKGPFREQ